MRFNNKHVLALGLGILAVVPSIFGQTNSIEQSQAKALRLERIRDSCIQNRRRICGKIVKILPDGLVVDSGYTNLLRPHVSTSWLISASVQGQRAANVVEQQSPGVMCFGQVFLTDVPKKPRPKLHDYVNLEAFPAGQYTYSSVGNVRKTVRHFSAKLIKAVQSNLTPGEIHD